MQQQQATITELKSTVARQQKGLETLTTQLKEQASQIRKVSAQLEMIKPAPQVVGNAIDLVAIDRMRTRLDDSR
jgi:septal ring factor EnvC (AmiA/AmiB activator)